MEIELYGGDAIAFDLIVPGLAIGNAQVHSPKSQQCDHDCHRPLMTLHLRGHVG